MKVFVTGANGFIGKNLCHHLSVDKDIEVICFTRNHAVVDLHELLKGVDFICHLAGSNRPKDMAEFWTDNILLTQELCNAVSMIYIDTGKKIPVIFTSSTQSNSRNPYGESKRSAEELIYKLGQEYQIPIYIFQLPNVFGKWCKPNYNSVVATFCHNISRNLPIKINDPSSILTLVYIDDVVRCFTGLIRGVASMVDLNGLGVVQPQYTITVGQLAQQLHAFKESRVTLVTERVGLGLTRALYSTYLSYLPKNLFAYTIPHHSDTRGSFTEMLKTPDCGQFSFFTALPGVTRGGHFHHTKTEKFLVAKGSALFKFRNMVTDEIHELKVDDKAGLIIETIPGWAHNITNIGNDELLVMLWANEIFDPHNPDTFSAPV